MKKAAWTLVVVVAIRHALLLLHGHWWSWWSTDKHDYRCMDTGGGGGEQRIMIKDGWTRAEAVDCREKCIQIVGQWWVGCPV